MADADEEAARLVRAAQRGDRTAFARLYERYIGLVKAIALSRLPIDEIADVAQETFLRALRRLKTLKNVDAFGAWISTITRNVVRDAQRRRFTQMPQDDVEPEAHPTQQSELEANAVRHVIESLPKAYRKTVAMRVVQGMTGPEIADRTGLSAGSVRVNLHRGMRLLRERLEAAIRKQRA